MEINTHVSPDILRRRRSDLGMSIPAIAAKAGLSVKDVRCVLDGTCDPNNNEACDRVMAVLGFGTITMAQHGAPHSDKTSHFHDTTVDYDPT